MFSSAEQHQCECMNFLKEQLNGTAEINKAGFFSQLFIVSTVEAEAVSNSVRKFSELHKLTIFLWKRFHWLRQIQSGKKQFKRVLVSS